MEKAERRELFYHNHHPYTEGLLASIPHPGADRTKRLLPIHGTPPSLIQLPTGCPFHPRCPYAFDRCLTETPPLAPVHGRADHVSACWLPSDEAERQTERERVQAVLARQREISEDAARTLAEVAS
jgi:peptide/nickel transport system ATP-binding protein